VRVANEAVPGPAVLRVVLVSTTGKRSRATDLPIVLVK
jgi:hypothetical protein